MDRRSETDVRRLIGAALRLRNMHLGYVIQLCIPVPNVLSSAFMTPTIPVLINMPVKKLLPVLDGAL